MVVEAFTVVEVFTVVGVTTVECTLGRRYFGGSGIPMPIPTLTPIPILTPMPILIHLTTLRRLSLLCTSNKEIKRLLLRHNPIPGITARIHPVTTLPYNNAPLAGKRWHRSHSQVQHLNNKMAVRLITIWGLRSPFLTACQQAMVCHGKSDFRV